MHKLLLNLAILAISLFSLQASAQTVGQKYHTREPRTCASPKEPKSGVLSAAQAAQYVACGLEHETSRQVFLASDVAVEVGKGTPFRELASTRKPAHADVDGVVYSIRGSYRLYQCNAPSSYTIEGQHCTRYDHAKAEGICYRSDFGDWSCSMSDASNPVGVTLQPPPRG